MRDFIAQRPQTITSPKVLAEKMAGKAALIKDILNNTLKEDRDARTELSSQFQAFREHLIHDITPEDFADIYAETIAYGMFAARLHDTTLDTFTRHEALDLLPKSNPFLRSLFGYIAGPDLDERIRWIIDDLANVFQAANVQKIMTGFGELTGRSDPFIHFYETFLAAYNPAKRKARGVWYTPEAVVNFIVRAVDEVLITEFGLPDGLADTSKVTIDWDTGQTDNKGRPLKTKKEVHRVQILDPATGTGTFLAEAIKQIAPKIKGVAEGMWSSYIERDLIPRLHGFELLMASYAMCHMKLDMILTEMGYRPTGTPPRLSVYLTNSLEEGDPANQTLPFAQWLSNEVKQANAIKRDMPIMCVIGNPPYSGHSSNKGEWIENLMSDYKVSPELKRPAQAKWLSDDYVKFIRFAEHMIGKNGEGVLGFITNHGYLDNPTFVDMRNHLRQTFDRIYILDLHGNAKKKEVSPDGTPDKNVFDIMQGVAIIVAVKRRNDNPSKKAAKILHGDLWGDRAIKYQALWKGTVTELASEDVSPEVAPWRFKSVNKILDATYQDGISIVGLFSGNGSPSPGFATQHDEFAISSSKVEALSKVEKFLSSTSEENARQMFSLCAQKQWNYFRAIQEIKVKDIESLANVVSYRPLDNRWSIFNKNILVHIRHRVSKHFINKENISLIITKNSGAIGSPNFDAVFSSRHASDLNLFRRGGAYIFPLYLYPEDGELDQARRVNFDPKLYKKLQKLATDDVRGTPDEVAVFDYIYGVLHCPAYRSTYAEFLKIDFPRIPWPTSPAEFWDVSDKGGQLRRLHLMEPAAIGPAPYPFKGEGDSRVETVRFEGNQVFINATQYFDNVPDISWGFYIGGYQPAQKWLKDRKGRELSFEDVKHYQNIIKILSETDRIMQTISLSLPTPEQATS
ncbi:type ISP restriction/modification enzyme [Asticcacaulis tiandongensis]|uniref:type ISP restriction/modification enzyme n=1 Tax=Asticcacaulis tiandongensis TaxID=2565365 RepID=UPI001C642A81|nr:type ISP restriction/modification enzyme [Asticcacaulis tiandongensis]